MIVYIYRNYYHLIEFVNPFGTSFLFLCSIYNVKTTWKVKGFFSSRLRFSRVLTTRQGRQEMQPAELKLSIRDINDETSDTITHWACATREILYRVVNRLDLETGLWEVIAAAVATEPCLVLFFRMHLEDFAGGGLYYAAFPEGVCIKPHFFPKGVVLSRISRRRGLY